MVLVEKKEARKIGKTKILVIDYKLVYKSITGRPKLGILAVVSSMVHLKLEYHIEDGFMDMVETYFKACSLCDLSSYYMIYGKESRLCQKYMGENASKREKILHKKIASNNEKQSKFQLYIIHL